MQLNNPKTFKALIPFTLTLTLSGESKPLSLNVNRNDIIQYDGEIASFRGHTGISLSLGKAVGVWIVEVTEDGEVAPAQVTATKKPTGEFYKTIDELNGKTTPNSPSQPDVAVVHASHTGKVEYDRATRVANINSPSTPEAGREDGDRTYDIKTSSPQMSADGIQMSIQVGGKDVFGGTSKTAKTKEVNGIEMTVHVGSPEGSASSQSANGVEIRMDPSMKMKAAPRREKVASSMDEIPTREMPADDLNPETRLITPNMSTVDDIKADPARPKPDLSKYAKASQEEPARPKADLSKYAKVKEKEEPVQEVSEEITIKGKSWDKAFWKDKLEFIETATVQQVQKLLKDSKSKSGKIYEALVERAKVLGIDPEA